MRLKSDIWRLPKEIKVNGLKSHLEISITLNGDYLIEYINEKGSVVLKACAYKFEQAFWLMQKNISKIN